VPAGVVYRTDAAISKEVQVAFEVRAGPEILYSVAPLAGRKAAARGLAEFLASAEAVRVFERHGFIVRDRAAR